jgi:geranylgeranylglycerol-phosphate geranylgeranyltransferase
LVGGWIGQGIILSTALIAAGFVGFLVCAFGNVVNDIKDLEIDRINNPERPLPSGKVSRHAASIMAVIFLIIGVLGSIPFGILPFFIVITAALLLFVYSAYIKKTLVSNLLVALIAGMSFLLGGLVAHNALCIIPFIFSIFIHVPREIVKDVMDMKGDKMAGIKTIPIIAGPITAYNISAILLGLLCLILPVPFISKSLNTAYILIVLLIAYPILFYTIWRLTRKPSKEELPLISNLMKASMAVGLVAMTVA